MVLCLEIAGGSVFGWGSSTAWECCVSGGEAVLGFSFFFLDCRAGLVWIVSVHASKVKGVYFRGQGRIV